MFNGIITSIGNIIAVLKNIFHIKTNLSKKVKIGDSVACSGVCLTVIEVYEDMISVEVSSATFSCTNLTTWQVGSKVNLELSMQIGQRLDGHFVLGHVDTLVRLSDLSLLKDGCYKIILTSPENFTQYIAYKGSVALDGVSLTINETIDNNFSINLLPYTFNNTTFQYNRVGDKINMEVDMLARYVNRSLEYNKIN